jgi:hypothetical protein
MNKRDKLKADRLIEQNGKCAICGKGSYCATCKSEVSEDDIEIIGKEKYRFYHKGYENHHIQMVNTLDHNHSHKKCNGCEKCAIGMTHDRCNRALNLLFEDKTQEFINAIIEYVKKGQEIVS